jgi:hypothetical protein
VILDEKKRYRYVPRAECPDGSRASIAAYIARETGNYVTVVSDPVPIGPNYVVECYSPDGRPVQNRPLPAPVHTDLMDLIKEKP